MHPRLFYGAGDGWADPGPKHQQISCHPPKNKPPQNSTDSFKKYQKEMAEFSMMFNEAKREIEKTYVLPIIGDKKVTWTLEYDTCELTITEVQ